MIYLKLVPFEFKIDTHDQRETSAAKELGFDVMVADLTDDVVETIERWNGYTIHHMPDHLPPYARRFQVWFHLNGIAFFYKFIAKVVQIDADVVSGHNYSLLLAAYIANFFKRKKAKLIYDSHEFELYKYAPNRTEFRRKILKKIEGFLIRRVNLSLMVGDKIADEVQAIYQLETRPTVVRNIPEYWRLSPAKTAVVRQRFLKRLKLSDRGFLLMYHGAITRGRGIEFAIQSLSLLPDDIGLVIMGYENSLGMVETLRRLAEEKGVDCRVLFHSAVPFEELKDYIGAVDVELILIEGKCCISYDYSLPNKFFESIQACVPIICANLPEMGKIVRQYDLGLLVDEGDEKNVADAVLKLRNEKSFYDRLKKNIKKAKEDLCWEKEKVKLKVAIQKMVGKAPDENGGA